ncbi:MAG TPA: flavodoxin family protein [Candidatus Aminicenantes bacterium]|nr:flavodoxin family protein [Candidatus Aminicenantes bacterium]HPL15030.1 flavodoxin family protein [Candidatus Aminicenantes bacterium]
MKSLIVYDTNYGHTRRVAEAVADGLGGRAVATAEVRLEELSGLDLLVAGSPIVGWKPTERMLAFLAELGRDRLKGVKAAAFDTRVKLFIHGDAAGKINRALEAAGAEIIEPPGFFYVKGKEGPLFEGEIEKAREWAGLLKAKAGS